MQRVHRWLFGGLATACAVAVVAPGVARAELVSSTVTLGDTIITVGQSISLTATFDIGENEPAVDFVVVRVPENASISSPAISPPGPTCFINEGVDLICAEPFEEGQTYTVTATITGNSAGQGVVETGWTDSNGQDQTSARSEAELAVNPKPPTEEPEPVPTTVDGGPDLPTTGNANGGIIAAAALAFGAGVIALTFARVRRS